MSTFSDINNLRRSGQLEEAKKRAIDALKKDPENIWNKRAASWVYYDFLKKYSQPEDFEAFKENLIYLKDLNLPEEENMVFDKSAWQIGRIVFALQNGDYVSYSKLNVLFDIIKDFYFTKPSEDYSFIHKAFLKGYKNWSKYLEFVEWWYFKNFRKEDHQSEDYDGKTMMSLAENAHLAYAKKLLEGEPLDAFGEQRYIDKNRIRAYIPLLDELIEKYPQFKYSSFFKAKLLLALGEDENVLSAFLPFAIKKRNDFWVWDLMADIFSNNVDMQFACYCKALSLNTNENFLVKLRQKFAKKLIERKMLNEAKTEIENIIKTRESQAWNLPNQIIQWKNDDWYKSTTPTQNNWGLYIKYKTPAEDILYKDIKEELVAVEFVNKHKNMLHFVINKNQHGFFKYSSNIGNPKIGDILKVRFSKFPKKGFSKIYTAKKISSDTQIEAIKSFEGWFERIPNKNFGFVDDIFVNSEVINKYNLEDSQILNGKAILSFNKSKEKYSWKCFEVC